MAGLVSRAKGWARLCSIALLLALANTAQAAQAGAGKLVATTASAAPALELRDMTGKLHRLGDYRGKVVLVNFWATWCEPCRDEMPSMRTLKQRIDRTRKDDFIVLAVNYGENEIRIGSFLQEYALDFPILIDPFSEAWRAWKPGLLPASFLVGRDGRLRYRVLGELDWAGEEATRVVQSLLREKP